MYSKKYDLVAGVPEKIDGPVQSISYEDQMPLHEEVRYFIQHLGSDKIDIANGKQGVDVVKVLEMAGKQLLRND